MITTSEAQATPQTTARTGSAVGRRVVAVWAGRGWWGGLIAMGLAAMGQQILVTQNDPTLASRYYILAALLLIAVLTHPDLSWLRRSKAETATPPEDATSTLPVRRARTAQPIAPALPVRRVRTAGAEAAAPTTARTIRPVPTPWTRLARLPARWEAVRARLGWRLTAGGLVLTLALAAGAAAILQQDITDPRGGWLWAGALFALILTFAGAAGWPRGGGLLPGPKSDFFAPGLPRLTPRWEAVLVGCLLALALTLRLTNLEYVPGIFGDEGERGMDARAINDGQPANIFGYGWWGVPNLYFYLVSWMLRLFGDTMTGDRMLSVISGIIAVWFVYRIARLLWGVRAGLIAGTLLAVSPLALQFSRLAGESTPTGALWAAGFFYLFLALRHRKWSDWVLAGTLMGFSLYFYAAGKLIIPLIAGVGLYCLVRWHINFFRRYFLGFLLLGLAFGLTFLPYALFSMKETPPWQSFTGRAQETSIFSPQNQVQAFAKYGIPYTPPAPGQSLVQQVLSNPVGWGQVILQQMRVTTEVIYITGDPTPFYQITEHRGSMLAPLWAALALLGLAYAGWKIFDGRFALASIWFWGGMLGAALTMDTPSVQRLTGAWPVIMLFPAAMLDRVAAAAWPLSVRLARRWSTVPLVALLIFFGGDSYREYFLHYGGMCTYCAATVQARYAQALGQEYKAYELGVGDYDIFFSYGSTRFAAKGIEGEDLAVPVDALPVTDNNNKGVAFIVYGNNTQYLPLIRLFYPGGTEAPILGSDGSTSFINYKLTRDQIAGFQTVHARYDLAGGTGLTRDEPGLGMERAAGQPPWAAPPGLTYPVQASWTGGLVAPGYGSYIFTLRGPADAKLEIDGQAVPNGGPTPLPGSANERRMEVVLAKGMHDVRLSGTLPDAATRLGVSWASGGDSPSPISANYLYNGPTGGLSGDVLPPLTTPINGTLADTGQQPLMRRSDPALGFREATVSLKQAGWLVRWRGTLQIHTSGTYSFETSSNGPSVVLIDGQVVVNNPANGGPAPANGAVALNAGAHPVEVRYGWQGGPARMEWFWTPPGGERALVPPADAGGPVLLPAQRSWAPGAVAVPPAQGITPPPIAPAAVAPLTPDAVLGADAGLKEPRGVAVDTAGNIYIGDTANHRIVRLGQDGKLAGQWGGATEAATPGKFNLLADLAALPDGHVFSLDAGNGEIQAFTSDGTPTLDIQRAASSASGIAVQASGQIWLADTGGGRVARFTAGGQPDQTMLGGESGTTQRLEQPIDVALAPDGTVYAVDLRGRIVRLDVAGNVVAQWPVEVGTTRGGSHLTVWKNLVVMTDPDRNRLTVLNPATGDVRLVGSAGTAPGQFRLPIGIAAGPDGKLYVVDSDNARVQVFSSLEPK